MIKRIGGLVLSVIYLIVGSYPTGTSMSTTSFSWSRSTTSRWSEKLHHIKQLSQRSVDLDLIRLGTALDSAYTASHSNTDWRLLNQTDMQAPNPNETWVGEAVDWRELYTNRTHSNHTLYLTQSDSVVLDKAPFGSRDPEPGLNALLPQSKQLHAAPTQSLDWSTTFQLVLSSLTLLVHFGWIGWIVMEAQFSRSCYACCQPSSAVAGRDSMRLSSVSPPTIFYATHRVYLRLQIHIGLVGTVYAVSVICSKLVVLLGPWWSGTPRPVEPNAAAGSCDVSRTISLLVLTVYWLNVVLCCVLSTRYVHRTRRWPQRQQQQHQRPVESRPSWTKSQTETFLCYFHSGAAWIYAILLHLCGLMFTHFPIHWPTEFTAEEDLPSEPRIRILSIDCQLRGSDQTGHFQSSLIGHSCEFTLAEYVLALVLSFLGDVIPVMIVIPIATSLVMISKRVASQVSPMKDHLPISRYPSAKGIDSTAMTSDSSSKYLLTPFRNGTKPQNLTKSMIVDPRHMRAFACFGVWIAILGFGLLLTHSIRISLHIRHLRHHEKWCTVRATASSEPSLTDSVRAIPVANSASLSWSSAWWFPQLYELAEIGLTCLVPAGFFSLTRSLKTASLGFSSRDTSPTKREGLTTLPLEPIASSQSDNGAHAVKSQKMGTTGVDNKMENSNVPVGSPLEPYELLGLGKFTRTQFIQQQQPQQRQLNDKTGAHGSCCADLSDFNNPGLTKPDLCAHLCARTIAGPLSAHSPTPSSSAAGETSSTTAAGLLCGSTDRPNLMPISVQVVSLHAFCCQTGAGADVQATGTNSRSGPSTDSPGLAVKSLSDEDWMPGDSSVGFILVPDVSNP